MTYPARTPDPADLARVLREAEAGGLGFLREERAPYGSLEAAVASLFAIAAEQGLDLVLAGGLAMLQWVPGRNTLDIDLIADPAALDAIPGLDALMKLFALPSLYRQGQVSRASLYEQDIRSLVEAYALDRDAAIDLLRPALLVTEIAELSQIAGEIRQAITRAGERQFGPPREGDVSPP